jgi:radical SAM protein with 4Fe4S-binding SPASM domain
VTGIYDGLCTLGGTADDRTGQQTGHDIRSLAALQRSRIHREGLRRCQVLLDTGCNARCMHCFLGAKHPVEDLETVIDLLQRQLPAAGLSSSLYYSEPFHFGGAGADRRDRVDEVLALVARHQPGLLLTNGIAVDEAAVERMAALGSFRVYLPLLGASAAHHDRLTRVPGSFRRMRRAVRLLSSTSAGNVELCFNVVLTRANADELPAMLQLAVDAGAASVFLMALHPGPDSPPELAELVFSPEQRRMLLPLLGAARNRFAGSLWIELGPSWGPNFHTRGIYRHLYSGRPYCPAGRSEVAVHPATGVIYPCMKLSGREEYAIGHWDWELGQPVVDPARNVLARLVEDPELLQGACSPRRCPYAPICLGGCRAVAASYADGDLLAEMPGCMTTWLDDLTPRRTARS